jgi:hypothetical protein
MNYIIVHFPFEWLFFLFDVKDTNKKVKSIYDGRLDDKDKIINNLQDRIQNFLYDGRGCSWNNVPPSPKINKSKPTPGPVVEHVQNSQTSVTESQNTTHIENNSTNHDNEMDFNFLLVSSMHFNELYNCSFSI